ncbi:hypothetical protein ACFZBU_36570 [Embleya sp. NPDC008237]|uniref:hypothetical protein n=1 Tax=Embleya sp. NPDC008237 TaxID=3363978 RepID=UPI0036E74760
MAADALLLAGCSDAKAERPPNVAALDPCALLTGKELDELRLEVFTHDEDGRRRRSCTFTSTSVLIGIGEKDVIDTLKLTVWDNPGPNDSSPDAKSMAEASRRAGNEDLTTMTVKGREIYRVGQPTSRESALYFPVNATSTVSAGVSAVSASAKYPLSDLVKWIEAKLPARPTANGQ